MEIVAPAVPNSIAETGINQDILSKLVAKVLQVHGTMTPSEIATQLRLPTGVVVLLLKELQALQYVESRGLAGSDMRAELRYALGGQGIEFAAMALAQSQYVGPAPVSLDAWIAQIKAQTISNARVSRAALEDALSHLILPPGLLDALGPAVNSAKSILLYGEPGNGKTSIAEAIGASFSDQIYIPHCFEVGGQIVNLFDPTLHELAEEPRSLTSSRPDFDQRWRLCKRPFVLAGGELTLEMLDLSYSEVSKFYEAPLHLKAIGGVFVVDDFGRQRTDPQAILNRWIVPLERRYDFLTLHTGKKFSIPFDQLAVFSTNIPPLKLADAGALRRLYYKLKISIPTAADYEQIFRDTAAKAGVPFRDDIFYAFFERHYADGKEAPAGFHPKYILDFVISVCRFREEEPHMDGDLLDAGWRNISTS